MFLSTVDQKKFYRLYYAAGSFVNAKRKVVPGVKKMTPQSCSYDEALKIADALRAHPEDMEEMAKDFTTKLSDEDRLIVASWTRILPGTYILVAHLPQGSIFVSEERRAAYLTIGLRRPLETMLPWPPPFPVVTCLMPFQGKIITDGFFDPCPDGIIPDQKENALAIYADALKNRKILTTI